MISQYVGDIIIVNKLLVARWKKVMLFYIHLFLLQLSSFLYTSLSLLRITFSSEECFYYVLNLGDKLISVKAGGGFFLKHLFWST